MSEAWHRPLADLRDRFAKRNDDLRHILLTLDDEVREVPDEWFARDPVDGFARWGLPPSQDWRRLPGEDQLRPVILQEPEYGYPFLWKHTFYGASAFPEFRRLARRAVLYLAKSPPVFLELLSEKLGLPGDPPRLAVQTPHLWWMRAVHEIAFRRHADTDLAADRWLAKVDPQVQWRPNKWREAVQSGRSGSPIISILDGHVFETSAWALDLIMGAVPVNCADQPLPDPGLMASTSESIGPTPHNSPLSLGVARGAAHVLQLIRSLDDLREYLWEWCEPRDVSCGRGHSPVSEDGKGPVYLREEGLAPLVRRLAQALDGTNPDDFPEVHHRRAGRALQAAREWLDDRLDAWGWRALIGPEGESHKVASEAAHHKMFKRPLLEAALSYDERDEELNFDERIVALAAEARRLGYSPTAATVSVDELNRLNSKLWISPLYGHAVPTLQPGDRETLIQLARNLERMIPDAPRAPEILATPEPDAAPIPPALSETEAPPIPPSEPPATSGNDAKAEPTISMVARKLPPPSEKAIQCYRILFLRGDATTQAATAKIVYGDPSKQSQVSRDIRRVIAWIKAGNVLPDLLEDKPKTYTIDPAKLDKGPGQAGRRSPR